MPLLANWDDVRKDYRLEVQRAAQKALNEGALAPLTYQGMGATGIVLCDDRAAWKVARRETIETVENFRLEYEFLLDASRESSISQHVAWPFALHVDPLMIERECIEQRQPQPTDRSKSVGRRDETFQRIIKLMNQRGWCGIEYKPDALVLHPRRGWVLVDAGFGARTGWALARYVRDILIGTRPLAVRAGSEEFLAKSLAWDMRMEVSKGALPQKVCDQLSAELRARWPWEGD